MIRSVLNLASEPFVNMRPLRRSTITMWVIGSLLMASNVWLYWSYYSGSAEGRATMAELVAVADAEEQRIVGLDEQIGTLDLEWQRQQVLFLNRQIQARTFSWSRLLDRVVEVLPADVRLIRLDPNFSSERATGGRAPRGRTEQIQLAIDGAAKTDDDVLAFIDALYSHPHFSQPSLLSEARRDDVLAFRVETLYLGIEDDEFEPAEAVTVSATAVSATAVNPADGSGSVSPAGPTDDGSAGPPAAVAEARESGSEPKPPKTGPGDDPQRAPTTEQPIFADLSDEDDEFRDFFGEAEKGDGEP